MSILSDFIAAVAPIAQAVHINQVLHIYRHDAATTAAPEPVLTPRL